LLKRVSASVVVLCLVGGVAAQAAPTACFTSDEAKAAHFRTLQQEFNVAALNCQSVNSDDPSIRTRYDAFIGKVGGKMQDNAHMLRSHFSRAGGNLDVWMTRVANDAGQRAVTDPEFCQRASDQLDKALSVQSQELDEVAATNASLRLDVPVCGDGKKTTVTASGKKPAKAHHKHKKSDQAEGTQAKAPSKG
jgi:hypothetical protein